MDKKTDGLLTLLLGAVIVFTLASSAEAYNSYLKDFNTLYGTSSSKLNSCDTCHDTNYKQDLIVELGSGLNITDALIAVEPLDSDGDGFTNIEEIAAFTFPGDPDDFPVVNCTDQDSDGYAMEGGVCGAIDCDDNDPNISPAATESCDGIDNNCDGQIDEGCPTCTDKDGDGYTVEGGSCGAIDCNDNDSAINPGVVEICDDGIDNNCDGQIDEGCLICTDKDGDGYAVEGGACGAIDCNDNDSAINPGVVEICDDGLDNNCNGQVDEGCPTCTDKDGDGYTVEGGSCGAIDCNDNDSAINPGAVEVCDDGIDNNCDGQIDEDCLICTDGDGDGYTVEGGSCGAIDCNDNDSAINPGAVEVCDDRIDNNCDGQIDEDCLICTDGDGDGYAVEGGACGAIDCNDNDSAINPGAVEVCDDGIDNNCNEQVDEGCSTCTDNDGDGYAVEGGSCGAIDCNDNDSAINPGAVEVCDDGIDNNCDGQVDEGCQKYYDDDDDDEEDHHRDDDWEDHHRDNNGRHHRAKNHD